MGTAVQFDIVPGAVVSRVFAHVLNVRTGPVACFSYVTDGLRAFRQREIVFTLTRHPNAPLEQAPREPLQLLQTIASLAQRGQLVTAGDMTEFGPSGLFNRPQLRGLAYELAWPMDGVDLAAGSLSAVVMVGHEIETVKRYGALRVLARLGRAHAFYPTAPWCDLDRAPISPPDTQTILEGVASARFPGITVVMIGERIHLRVGKSAHPALAQALPQLPPEAGVALLASLDPNADACLVWTEGQQAPEAISPPGGRGERLSGCFALMVPQQASDGGNPFEDGFAITLTDPSWAAVRNALQTGQSIEIRGQKSLVVEWVDDAIPTQTAPAISEMKMTLRESQADIDQRVGMNALVGYADAMEKAVHRHFAGPAQASNVKLQLTVTLSPGRPAYCEVASLPPLPSLNALHALLASLPSPPVRGDIAFRGEFSLWP